MMILARTAISIAAFTATTFAAMAAKEHDNEVFFAINGLQSFNFTENPNGGHCVSAGQPYSGTTAGISNGKGEITVKAGRQNTTAVATCFKNWVGSGQTLVCDAKGTYPDQLNFAVIGTMTIGSTDGNTITCENVIVAQGNFAKTNNWWMGGPEMKGAHIGPIGATEQTCKDAAGRHLPAAVVFAPQTPCVNNFSIGVNQPE